MEESPSEASEPVGMAPANAVLKALDKVLVISKEAEVIVETRKVVLTGVSPVVIGSSGGGLKRLRTRLPNLENYAHVRPM